MSSIKTFAEFLTEEVEVVCEQVTRQDLRELEKVLDKAFAKNGIDFNFTQHFLERANDSRNGKEITVDELRTLFLQTQKLHGDKIAKKEPGFEAIIKDFNSNVNSPFVLKWDSRNNELDLIAKTVMRKKNFVSNAKEPVFKVW